MSALQTGFVLQANRIGSAYFCAVDGRMVGLHLRTANIFVVSLIQEPLQVALGSFRLAHLAQCTNSAVGHLPSLAEAFIHAFEHYDPNTRQVQLRYPNGGSSDDAGTLGAASALIEHQLANGSDSNTTAGAGGTAMEQAAALPAIQITFPLFGLDHVLTLQLNPCPNSSKDPFVWSVIADMYRATMREKITVARQQRVLNATKGKGRVHQQRSAGHQQSPRADALKDENVDADDGDSLGGGSDSEDVDHKEKGASSPPKSIGRTTLVREAQRPRLPSSAPGRRVPSARNPFPKPRTALDFDALLSDTHGKRSGPSTGVGGPTSRGEWKVCNTAKPHQLESIPSLAASETQLLSEAAEKTRPKVHQRVYHDRSALQRELKEIESKKKGFEEEVALVAGGRGPRGPSSARPSGRRPATSSGKGGGALGLGAVVGRMSKQELEVEVLELRRRLQQLGEHRSITEVWGEMNSAPTVSTSIQAGTPIVPPELVKVTHDTDAGDAQAKPEGVAPTCSSLAQAEGKAPCEQDLTREDTLPPAAEASDVPSVSITPAADDPQCQGEGQAPEAGRSSPAGNTTASGMGTTIGVTTFASIETAGGVNVLPHIPKALDDGDSKAQSEGSRQMEGDQDDEEQAATAEAPATAPPANKKPPQQAVSVNKYGFKRKQPPGGARPRQPLYPAPPVQPIRLDQQRLLGIFGSGSAEGVAANGDGGDSPRQTAQRINAPSMRRVPKVNFIFTG